MSPWQPGQSGNPKGRPKGSKSYTTLLKELAKTYMAKKFTHPFTGEETKITGAELAAFKLIENIEKGQLPSIQEFAERIEGKVPDKKMHGEDPEHPFNRKSTVEYVMPKQFEEPRKEDEESANSNRI